MNLEARTVAAMIHIYCRAHHGAAQDLCADCAGLLAYAQERIFKCPFGIDKPVCSQCTVHCYQPEQRERIKVVMRYAGPRMLWRHPLLAIRHLYRSRYFGGRSK
ncbi:MAG: nitrous oxide-stimulated promoter family protein [Kiritimatiellales bacterium]|nr:nitrous oxide-stimulated promoter family protein [Kiritimatiellales bacterium]